MTDREADFLADAVLFDLAARGILARCARCQGLYAAVLSRCPMCAPLPTLRERLLARWAQQRAEQETTP
jgi:hypothetical protein